MTPWTAAEKAAVRNNWGAVDKAAWSQLLPARTYAAIKRFAYVQGIRAADHARRLHRSVKINEEQRWSAEEIKTLRNFPRAEAILRLAPRRTPGACERKARKLRYRKPREQHWSADEVSIVFNHDRETAYRLLAPKRSPRAVDHVALRLRLLQPSRRPDWTAPELALLRNIIRCVEALQSKYSRSSAGIWKKAETERRAIAFHAAAVAAVAAACAGLSPDVRADVEGDLLVQVLSKELPLDGLAGAVRAARTRAYGRRHYSLDAPIGDGATRWIDTIADDRAHF